MSINNIVRRSLSALNALNFPRIPGEFPSGVFVVRPKQAGIPNTKRTIKFYPDGPNSRDTVKLSSNTKNQLTEAFEEHPDAAYRYKKEGAKRTLEGKTTEGHIVSYREWLKGIIASTTSDSKTGLVKTVMYPSDAPNAEASIQEESVNFPKAKEGSLKFKQEIANVFSRRPGPLGPPASPPKTIPATNIANGKSWMGYLSYLPNFSFWEAASHIPTKPITFDLMDYLSYLPNFSSFWETASSHLPTEPIIVKPPSPPASPPISVEHQLTLGEAAKMAALYNNGMGKGKKTQPTPVQALFNTEYVPKTTKTKIDLEPLLEQGRVAIRQRNTGDCYLLAALTAALKSKTGYELLTSFSSLFVETNKEGERIYQFTFPTGLTAKVHESELGKTSASGNMPLDGASVLQLLELTYAKAMNAKSANPVPPEDVLKGIGKGGKEHVALKNMLGGSVIPDTESEEGIDKVLARKRRSANTSYILSTYTGKNNRKPIEGKLSTGQEIRLPYSHAYALLVDPTDRLRVIDPHDTEDKVYAMGRGTFHKFFQGVNGIGIPRRPKTSSHQGPTQ